MTASTLNNIIKKYQWWIIVGLLLLQSIIIITSVQGKSPTFDEPYHVAVGHDIWVNNAQRYDFVNPSGSRRFLATPLLLIDLKKPENASNQGVLADEFSFHNTVEPDTIFLYARTMTLIPTFMLGIGIFLWSKQLVSVRGGMAAVLFYALDPNIAAHGGLATTDVLSAAGFFWTIFSYWKFTKHQSVFWALVAGLSLGIALVAKSSMLLLLPITWLLLMIFSEQLQKRAKWLWLATYGIAALLVLAESGFELVSLAEFSNEQLALQGKAIVENWPAWALVRIPFFRYIVGIWTAFGRFSGPSLTYFMGETLTSGNPLYFPTVFLFKSTVPLLLTLGLGLYLFFKELAYQVQQKSFQINRHVVFFGIPIVLYTLSLLFSGLNIGYRHILPVLTFAFPAIAWVVEAAFDNWSIAKWAVLVTLSWAIIEFAVIYPNYLAYFNPVVGGPEKGHHYFVDSNLDWGQELKNLALFQDNHQTGPLYLSYFGSADPAAYGVEVASWPAISDYETNKELELPQSGWIAISASCLKGLCLNDSDRFNKFSTLTPDAVLGHSIFLYEIP